MSSPSLKLTGLADKTKIDIPAINFRSQALHIVLAGSLLLLIAVALDFAALNEFSASNNTWKMHSQRAVVIGDTLAELKSDIGYGGFIHNFKNLVLRRDVNRYQPLIERNITDIQRHLAILETLLDAPQDKIAINQVSKVFSEYTNKYRIALTMIGEGKNSEAIDAVVRLSDTDTIAALQYLSSRVRQHTQDAELKSDTALSEARHFLILSGIAIFFTIATAVFVLVFYLRQIAKANRVIHQKQAKIRHKNRELEATLHELKITEERFAFALEGSGDGLWDWDIEHNKVNLSTRWKTMLGHEEHEIGHELTEWSSRVHPEDMPRVMADVEANLEGKTNSFANEHRVLCKDGRYLWILDRGMVVKRDADGKPLRMVGTHTDISATKYQEASLLAARDQLAKAAEVAEMGIWTLDINDGALLWNERMHEIYEVPAELRNAELTYDFWQARIHPEDVKFADTKLKRALENNETYNPIFRIQTLKGHVRYIQATGSVERDNLGKPTHIMGINRDITQQYETEDILRKAKQDADDASKAKSEFLANMSHELRTPMNAILGMLTLLRKTELTPRQADYAAKTEGATRALLGLLNDILDVSKAEAGKMTLDPHPFSIEQVLTDLAVILSANVGNKPVEVLFDIAPNVPRHLVGDAMRLHQVLVNLGGNAIKFTSSGEIVLSIDMLERQDASVTLQFNVRDTGIGIGLENQKRIFKGFTQAEASTTRRFGGTGLGVAISQHLVSMMGGKLELQSVLGQGSRFFFTITLPIAQEMVGQGSDTNAVTEKPLHALMVDDNPTAREVLARIGESLGWNVELAESGAQALELIQARALAGEAYQAIFIDWQMPEMDGWEASRRIHDLDLKPSSPVVVMVTAHGREMLSQRSEIDQALISGFLVKPVTASMLLGAVSEARTGAQGAKTSHITAPRLSGMHVLLVEDNLNNQQVAYELLVGEGALVKIAGNGREAVECIAASVRAESPFDVVLMDLQMPVMDGFTATKRIRKDLDLPNLPIIAMTANAMASDREACIKAGMDDHVGKPFDLDHLTSVLRNQVGWPPFGTESLDHEVTIQSDVNELATDAGVDLHAALKRMGGKKELYIRMLPMFLSSLENLPEQLQAELARADHLSASRLLHSLKGLASTMGAVDLAALAGKGEQRLASVNDTQIEGQVSSAIAVAIPKLNRLLSALHQDSSPFIEQDNTPIVDTQEAIKLFPVLEQHLKNFDMAALSVMNQLHRLCGNAFDEQLNPLRDAIDALNFEHALELSSKLVQSDLFTKG